MSEGSEPGDRKPSSDAARRERLAQALRANLKRRKAQMRGRSADTRPESTADRDET